MFAIARMIVALRGVIADVRLPVGRTQKPPLIFTVDASVAPSRKASIHAMTSALPTGRRRMKLAGKIRLVALCVAVMAKSHGHAESLPQYEIAFASFAPLNSDIFVADADGHNPRPFLPDPNADSNASFSPDGSWIIFTSRRGGSSDIYRAKLDGSQLEPLVQHRAYDDQAAISPDGETLAFVSRAG